MDSRSTTPRVPGPDAIEFVRFCYRRKHVGWPELYDEMCAVAGRSLFRGFNADDLSGIGIGLCLGDMPGLAVIVHQVVAEDLARRRPVAVTIVAEPDAPSAEPNASASEDSRRAADRLVALPAGA